MKHLTDIELAWLAGLLEGEGTFYAKSQPYGPRPALGLSMTDQDIVQRVADMLIITSVYRRPARSAEHKDQYEIRLIGKRAIEVMRAILPLMGERRQAKIVELLEL